MKSILTLNKITKFLIVIGLALLLIILAYYLILDNKFNSDAPIGNYPKPQNIAEARNQDLDYLMMFFQLEKSFTKETMDIAERYYRQLIENASELSDTEFELAVAKIVAAANNGHTKIREYDRTPKYNRLPIRGNWFADGYFIIRAYEGFEQHLGDKIIAIDGAPMFEVLQKLRPYIGGTDETFHKYLPYLIESPDLLHAANITNNKDKMHITFDLNGTSRDVTIKASKDYSKDQIARTHYLLSPSVFKISQPKWQSVMNESDQLPIYLQQPLESFQTKPMDELNAFYVQFRTNNDSATQSISEFCDKAMSDFKKSNKRFLIMDQRFNSGGNMLKTKDCMRDFPSLVPHNGHIFLITSNITFSAGIYSAAYIAQFGGEKVSIVGTQVGDSLITWAEDNLMVLPNSKIQIKFSTGKHDLINGCSDWDNCFWMTRNLNLRVKSLMPDIYTPLFYSDYIKNIDPAITAIKEQISLKI